MALVPHRPPTLVPKAPSSVTALSHEHCDGGEGKKRKAPPDGHPQSSEESSLVLLGKGGADQEKDVQKAPSAPRSEPGAETGKRVRLGLSYDLKIARVLACVAEELKRLVLMPTTHRVVTLLGGGYRRQCILDGLRRARVIFHETRDENLRREPKETANKAAAAILRLAAEISSSERERNGASKRPLPYHSLDLVDLCSACYQRVVGAKGLKASSTVATEARAHREASSAKEWVRALELLSPSSRKSYLDELGKHLKPEEKAQETTSSDANKGGEKGVKGDRNEDGTRASTTDNPTSNTTRCDAPSPVFLAGVFTKLREECARSSSKASTSLDPELQRQMCHLMQQHSDYAIAAMREVRPDLFDSFSEGLRGGPLKRVPRTQGLPSTVDTGTRHEQAPRVGEVPVCDIMTATTSATTGTNAMPTVTTSDTNTGVRTNNAGALSEPQDEVSLAVAYNHPSDTTYVRSTAPHMPAHILSGSGGAHGIVGTDTEDQGEANSRLVVPTLMTNGEIQQQSQPLLHQGRQQHEERSQGEAASIRQTRLSGESSVTQASTRSPMTSTGTSGGVAPRKNYKMHITDHQLNILQQHFEDTSASAGARRPHYLTKERKRAIAMETGLDEKAVSLWFKKERTNLKSQTRGARRPSPAVVHAPHPSAMAGGTSNPSFNGTDVTTMDAAHVSSSLSSRHRMVPAYEDNSQTRRDPPPPPLHRQEMHVLHTTPSQMHEHNPDIQNHGRSEFVRDYHRSSGTLPRHLNEQQICNERGSGSSIHHNPDQRLHPSTHLRRHFEMDQARLDRTEHYVVGHPSMNHGEQHQFNQHSHHPSQSGMHHAMHPLHDRPHQHPDNGGGGESSRGAPHPSMANPNPIDRISVGHPVERQHRNCIRNDTLSPQFELDGRLSMPEQIERNTYEENGMIRAHRSILLRDCMRDHSIRATAPRQRSDNGNGLSQNASREVSISDNLRTEGNGNTDGFVVGAISPPPPPHPGSTSLTNPNQNQSTV